MPVAVATPTALGTPSRLKLPEKWQTWQATAGTPRPVITATTIRETRQLAEDEKLGAGFQSVLRVAEAERLAVERVPKEVVNLAKSKAVPPQVAETYEHILDEAKAKVREELPPPPEVRTHLRWEAFKAGIATLATHMGRQALTNIRALTTETKEALKYQLKQQLGIDLDKAVKEVQRGSSTFQFILI